MTKTDSLHSSLPMNHRRRLVQLAACALWSCVEAAPTEPSNLEQAEPLSSKSALLEGTPAAGTPASDSAYSIVVANGSLIARNLAPPEPPVRIDGAKIEAKEQERASPGAPIPKLANELEARIEQLGVTGGDELQNVIVTFKDRHDTPRFGTLKTELGRGAAENVNILRANEALVARMVDARKNDYEVVRNSIAPEYGARVKETFWLMNGAVMQVPAKRLRSLAARENVQFVEPVDTETPPPANDLRTVQGLLNIGWLYWGNSSGLIGLLDTGVRATHERLASRIWSALDCVNGTSASFCTAGSNLNPGDVTDHGTSTAHALSGMYYPDPAHQGLSTVLLNSYRVYKTDGFLSSEAAIRGFQAAVAAGVRLIVAEMQSTQPETGALATIADKAYDAGIMVVAANGNQGPNLSTVRCPANAHKVIAVGNHRLSTNATADKSSRGPTADGRTKPDLMGFSGYLAASSASDTAYDTSYGGTSGATPTVAAAMILWRNWTGTPNPGSQYAAAIALGDNHSGDAQYNNERGAGLWRSPNSFQVYGNAVSISSGQIVEVTFPAVNAGDARVQGAIWWPEGTTTHNDIDLFLVNPNGTVIRSSISNDGVFEKVTANLPMSGTWKLRIKGYSVTGTQTVYYAALRVTN